MNPIGLTHATSTVAGLSQLPLKVGDKIGFSFDGPAGLYAFSVIMDARDFDWEQLYETLNKYHNENERTGPWDFSINFGAIPLVPAFWVTINGRRIGLWFFERVSLEDIEHKRFRGKFGFYADGPTTVELEEDTVVLDEPRKLSWLFQGKDEVGVGLKGLVGMFGGKRVAKIEPHSPELKLQARVAKTPVVYSYAGSFKTYSHVRYDGGEAVRAAVADFALTW